jgi:hypothetical protein
VYILVSGELIAHPGLSGLVQDQRAMSEMAVATLRPGHTLLVAFLSRIDLFLLWTLILLMVSARVTTRLSRRKSALITLGVWVLLTALGLVPALIGGLFAAQAGL